MAEKIDYGLAFNIYPRMVKGRPIHEISAALVSSDQADEPILVSFGYRLPELLPHGPRRWGASETIGIFGGVDDRAQRAVSEVVERNIGDALTLALMKLLGRMGRKLEDGLVRRLLVLGPPIPKVVGRFASLRIPRSFLVGWFYCFPAPKWLAAFPGWDVVARSGQQLSRLWMEDELLVEDHRVLSEMEIRVAWLNQYVSFEAIYENAWMHSTADDDLAGSPWVDAAAKLPHVLSLATFYTLIERARRIGLKTDGMSLPDLLVAAATVASAGSESDGDLEGEFLMLRSRLESDVYALEAAQRGGGVAGTEDLPKLCSWWQSVIA